jgi:hypothetical protein
MKKTIPIIIGVLLVTGLAFWLGKRSAKPVEDVALKQILALQAQEIKDTKNVLLDHKEGVETFFADFTDFANTQAESIEKLNSTVRSGRAYQSKILEEIKELEVERNALMEAAQQFDL